MTIAYLKVLKNSATGVINLDVLGCNRPASLEWPAIRAQASLKHKAKALLRVLKNGVRGLQEGKDIVLVAGREKNRGLAGIVAESMQGSAGLRVKEFIGDDCG